MFGSRKSVAVSYFIGKKCSNVKKICIGGDLLIALKMHLKYLHLLHLLCYYLCMLLEMHENIIYTFKCMLHKCFHGFLCWCGMKEGIFAFSTTHPPTFTFCLISPFFFFLHATLISVRAMPYFLFCFAVF